MNRNNLCMIFFMFIFTLPFSNKLKLHMINNIFLCCVENLSLSSPTFAMCVWQSRFVYPNEMPLKQAFTISCSSSVFKLYKLFGLVILTMNNVGVFRWR